MSLRIQVLTATFILTYHSTVVAQDYKVLVKDNEKQVMNLEQARGQVLSNSSQIAFTQKDGSVYLYNTSNRTLDRVFNYKQKIEFVSSPERVIREPRFLLTNNELLIDDVVIDLYSREIKKSSLNACFNSFGHYDKNAPTYANRDSDLIAKSNEIDEFAFSTNCNKYFKKSSGTREHSWRLWEYSENLPKTNKFSLSKDYYCFQVLCRKIINNENINLLPKLAELKEVFSEKIQPIIQGDNYIFLTSPGYSTGGVSVDMVYSYSFSTGLIKKIGMISSETNSNSQIEIANETGFILNVENASGNYIGYGGVDGGLVQLNPNIVHSKPPSATGDDKYLFDYLRNTWFWLNQSDLTRPYKATSLSEVVPCLGAGCELIFQKNIAEKLFVLVKEIKDSRLVMHEYDLKSGVSKNETVVLNVGEDAGVKYENIVRGGPGFYFTKKSTSKTYVISYDIESSVENVIEQFSSDSDVRLIVSESKLLILNKDRFGTTNAYVYDSSNHVTSSGTNLGKLNSQYLSENRLYTLKNNALWFIAQENPQSLKKFDLTSATVATVASLPVLSSKSHVYGVVSSHEDSVIVAPFYDSSSLISDLPELYFFKFDISKNLISKLPGISTFTPNNGKGGKYGNLFTFTHGGYLYLFRELLGGFNLSFARYSLDDGSFDLLSADLKKDTGNYLYDYSPEWVLANDAANGINSVYSSMYYMGAGLHNKSNLYPVALPEGSTSQSSMLARIFTRKNEYVVAESQILTNKGFGLDIQSGKVFSLPELYLQNHLLKIAENKIITGGLSHQLEIYSVKEHKKVPLNLPLDISAVLTTEGVAFFDDKIVVAASMKNGQQVIASLPIDSVDGAPQLIPKSLSLRVQGNTEVDLDFNNHFQFNGGSQLSVSNLSLKSGQQTLSGLVSTQRNGLSASLIFPNELIGKPVDLEFSISNSGGEMTSSSLSIDIIAGSAPQANPDKVDIRQRQTASVDVLANDFDADSHKLKIVHVSSTNGKVGFENNNIIKIEPPAEYVGEYEVHYEIADEYGARAESVVKVKVIRNSSPVLQDDKLELDEGQTLVIDVLANDSDSDGDRLQLVSVGTSLGEVSIQDNKLKYTARSSGGSVDTFTYTVSDGVNTPVAGKVMVSVKRVVTSNPDNASSSGGGFSVYWLAMFLLLGCTRYKNSR